MVYEVVFPVPVPGTDNPDSAVAYAVHALGLLTLPELVERGQVRQIEEGA